MPIPVDYGTGIVTGTFTDTSGDPVVGTVSFTPSASRLVGTGAVILSEPVVVELDAGGSLSVTLPASDDPNVNPTDFTYRVDETFIGVVGSTYFIDVLEGETLDLSNVLVPGTVNNGTVIMAAILPSQTGNAGKFLNTDGTNLSWEEATGYLTDPDPETLWATLSADGDVFVDFTRMDDGPIPDLTNGRNGDPVGMFSFSDYPATFQPCVVIDGAVQSDMTTPAGDGSFRTGFALLTEPGTAGMLTWGHGGYVVADDDLLESEITSNVAVSDSATGNAYLCDIKVGRYDLSGAPDAGEPVRSLIVLIRDDLSAPTTLATTVLDRLCVAGDRIGFSWDAAGNLAGYLNGVELVSVTDTTHDISTFDAIGMPLHQSGPDDITSDAYFVRVEWLGLAQAAAPVGATTDASDLTSGTLPFARLPVGTTSTTVRAGNDGAYTDARTPSTGGGNDDIMQRKSGGWTFRTLAQVKTDLAIRLPPDPLSGAGNGYAHFVPGGDITATNAAAALSANRNINAFWTFDEDMTITPSVEWNVAGAGGSLARLWICNVAAGTWQPTGVAHDFGTIATDTTANASAEWASSHTFTRGYYLARLVTDGAATFKSWNVITRGAALGGTIGSTSILVAPADGAASSGSVSATNTTAFTFAGNGTPPRHVVRVRKV